MGTSVPWVVLILVQSDVPPTTRPNRDQEGLGGICRIGQGLQSPRNLGGVTEVDDLLKEVPGVQLTCLFVKSKTDQLGSKGIRHDMVARGSDMTW